MSRPSTIYQARQRFFNRRVKEVNISQTLYHGSPLSGLREIKQSGRVRPQGHGELPDDWFCVSANDNVLDLFADGEKCTGLIFEPKRPLRCLHLDDFHHALVCYEAYGHFEEKQMHQVDWALKLGYVQGWREAYGMESQTFQRLLPDWVDGLIFPWSIVCPTVGLSPASWNDECEIALTDRGCQAVWEGLEQVCIDRDWFEPAEGWKEMNKALRRRRAKLTCV